MLPEAWIGGQWIHISQRRVESILKLGIGVTNLIEVDAHALELKLRGAIVNTVAVETVLARDGLPESSTNLVALHRKQGEPRTRVVRIRAAVATYALAGLEVNLFANKKCMVSKTILFDSVQLYLC